MIKEVHERCKKGKKISAQSRRPAPFHIFSTHINIIIQSWEARILPLNYTRML